MMRGTSPQGIHEYSSTACEVHVGLTLAELKELIGLTFAEVPLSNEPPDVLPTSFAHNVLHLPGLARLMDKPVPTDLPHKVHQLRALLSNVHAHVNTYTCITNIESPDVRLNTNHDTPFS